MTRFGGFGVNGSASWNGDPRVLAWAGRDVQYEQKEREFLQLSPAERTGKEPPAKHRFPKGFHRGQCLHELAHGIVCKKYGSSVRGEGIIRTASPI